MDPFSISAACVGVIASVTKLSTQISILVMNVRDARRDLDAVSRELSSLSLCLEALRVDTTTIQYPEGIRQTLLVVLKNCDDVTKEMEALLKKASSQHMGRQIQWAMTTRDEMNKLRLNLEAYKSSIEIALELVSMYVTFLVVNTYLFINSASPSSYLLEPCKQPSARSSGSINHMHRILTTRKHIDLRGQRDR
jgi:Fungal N-terminal domain of STAND proteins